MLTVIAAILGVLIVLTVGWALMAAWFTYVVFPVLDWITGEK